MRNRNNTDEWMRGDKISKIIWDILCPLAVYWAVVALAMFSAQSFLGAGEERYMLCQILAGLVTLPVMYFGFYRKDKGTFLNPSERAAIGRRREERAEVARETGKVKEAARMVFWIIFTAACLGIALNNLISMSPLIDMSAGYEEANRHFYGSTLVLELLGAALVTPLLEELVYRGILYGRLRRYAGLWPGVIVSALIFAVMHFNLVQFVYALCLGVALALFMEVCGHVWGAFIGHVTANFIAVIRTETGILDVTMDGSVFAWGFSVALLLVGVGLLVWAEKYCENGLINEIKKFRKI